MRYMLIIAAAATALLPVASAGASPAAVTFTTAAMAAAAQARTVDHAFLRGRWTDNNNCSDAIDFMADGTWVTTDGVRGRWVLEGDRLSFHGNRVITARVSAPDANTINLIHADGSNGRSTRCPQASQQTRTMPALPATVAEALAISRPLLEREYLLGTWTDSGDCAVAITFAADGGFTIPTGNGRWTLVGERLTFIGERTIGARARRVGQDRILLLHDDGSIGQSIRC